jgi:putative endonuclease
MYIGLSNDPIRRLGEHNAGQNKSTKYYKQYKLVLIKEFNTRELARQEEKRLKSGIGREWIRNNFMGL